MKEIQKLRQFILEKAKQCIHAPAGQLKSTFVTPSFAVVPGVDDNSIVAERSLTGHYLQMYDWDACFFSQAAQQIGVPGLAQDVVGNFLSLQKNDGYIPRTISPQKIWDDGDLCKPFLAQTLLLALQCGDIKHDQLVTKHIDQLDSYLQYYIKHRCCSSSGLYHWRNALESGVDNNLSLLAPREAQQSEDSSVSDMCDGRLLACDLSAYVVQEFSAFATLVSTLADKVGEEKKKLQDLSIKYNNLAKAIKQAIEDKLWNGKLSLYCNLDPKSNEQIKIRSWTGLVPVLLGIVTSERIEEVIRKNILSEEHFLRPAGLASVAASELLYNQAKRGQYGRAIVSNWQGPAWVLSNVLTVRCLLKNGFEKEARDLSNRVVKTLSEALEQTGTLFENYHAETGKPLWAPDFMSWNVLTLELIDLLL